MRWNLCCAAVVACLAGTMAGASLAGETPAAVATARDGMGLAASAADSWADDARLVWVENDTALDPEGHASAWGYLYYSLEKHAMRSWSVRDGHIVVAADHTVSAEAPALETNWLDSAEIANRAWEGGGREFCATGGGLAHLLLVRGVFAPETAWVAVFDNGAGPSLYVLVNAASGDVKKRWRG